MRRALFLALIWLACVGLFGAIHVSNSVPSDIGEILLHDGDLLIVNGQNGILTLYDVSDLVNPVRISSIPEVADCKGAAIEGNLLYVLDLPEQIIMVDIGDPATPEVVQSIEIGGHASSITLVFFGVLNHRVVFLYRIYQNYEVHTRWLCWDVSDIEQPSLTTFMDTVEDSPELIQLFDDRAYVFDESILSVFDITQPGWALENTFNWQYTPLDMRIRDGILYTTTRSALSMYQLPSTGSAELLDRIGVIGGKIHLEDNSILIQRFTYNDDPFDLVDVRNPEALEIVGSITLPEKHVVIDGDNLYIEIDGYWTQFDFSSPENNSLIGEISGLTNYPVTSFEFEIIGNYLFSMALGYTSGRFLVHNIENPAAPSQVVFFYVYHETAQYDIYDHYLFLADRYNEQNTLKIYDLSNLSPPERVSTYDAGVVVVEKDIQVRGDYVYYAHDSNLSIIFINTMEDPLLHTEMSIAGPNDHIHIDNDLMFMWDEDNGMSIYTLENLVVPEFITSIQPGTIRDVAFFDSGFAIIGDTGAKLYDITDPEAPILTSTIEPGDKCSLETGLFDGTRFLLADNRWYRIFIYDVGDLQNPERIHTCRWNHPTSQMQLIDDCLYAANGYPFISMIDWQMIDNDPQDVPKPDFGLTNYPNPFNPTTTILMNLPEGGHAGLTIYNIKGQKVKTLLDDWVQAGEHRISWDGKDDDGAAQPSGVYLYRMRCNDVDTCRKMILMK